MRPGIDIEAGIVSAAPGKSADKVAISVSESHGLLHDMPAEVGCSECRLVGVNGEKSIAWDDLQDLGQISINGLEGWLGNDA